MTTGRLVIATTIAAAATAIAILGPRAAGAVLATYVAGVGVHSRTGGGA